ncbi:hypothetical protein LAZ67_15000504 [Cordylochernes scorpioides]|uniref:Uncharacterized protein n=1 Tax=Cordylochernes scorpioides TaxID=51811 RepID=A0ABY6L858_9ARAC|nr:hypothetical protein LAZ67_15000504 [Cordylochernes scorpioides]
MSSETKRQSSQWLEPGEPRFKKARMIKSKLKCLLITYFDVKGLVHYEFVRYEPHSGALIATNQGDVELLGDLDQRVRAHINNMSICLGDFLKTP